jgi:hypothetical protein
MHIIMRDEVNGSNTTTIYSKFTGTQLRSTCWKLAGGGSFWVMPLMGQIDLHCTIHGHPLDAGYDSVMDEPQLS